MTTNQTEACSFKACGQCKEDARTCACAHHRPTAQQVKRLQSNLVEFGYSGLPLQDVEDAVKHLMSGAPVKDRPDIITMMANTMLKEAGFIRWEN